MAVRRSEKYIKFLIYLVVVVLVNIAGQTLFFRWDLTGNKIYSLSAGFREGVDFVVGQIPAQKKGLPGDVNEHHHHQVDQEFDIFFRSTNGHVNSLFFLLHHEMRGIQDQKGDTHEIDQIAGIDDAPGDVLEMQTGPELA